MDGWGKIAAGVALGIAGTVYATNRRVREKLPDAARDLPDSVKRRFEDAVNAAKEASASRREEILNDLSRHSAAHPPRPTPRQQAAASAPRTDFEPDFVVGKGVGEGEGASIVGEEETPPGTGAYKKNTKRPSTEEAAN
ncbi:MAG: hypothetical protein ACR2KW_09110 [Rubrobacter sp.]